MTELAVRSQPLSEKLEYARFLAASGLLPAQYRDKPANVLYATEYGEMLGISTLAAVLGVHVIEGKPSASAALVSGLVREAGHRIRTWGNDEEATTEIVRSDDPDFTYRSVWTLERARKAELLGKSNWKKYPAAQLKARTVTEAARDACQEILMGLAYTPEELGADVDADGLPIQATATRLDEPVSSPPPARDPAADVPAAADPGRDWDAELDAAVAAQDIDRVRELYREAKGLLDVRQRITAAARDLTAALAAQAPPDDEPLDAEVIEDGPASQPQHAHMHVLWGKAELTDRDDRLAVTSLLVGRPITSSKDLTSVEASKLLERLVELDERGAGALYTQVSRWLDEATAAPEDPPEEPS